MRNLIRRLHNSSNIYLLPSFSLATAGALLIGLLYYPTPSPSVADHFPTVGGASENDKPIHTDTLFVIMLADALRQLRMEQEPQTRALVHPDEHSAHLTEEPVMPKIAPPTVVNSCTADRPILIHL